MGVFDDILKSVKKGAGVVASRTREAADRGRIWLDVNSLRTERKDLLTKLGEQVMAMREAGQPLDESMEPILSEIDRLGSEIAVKEEQARRVGAEEEAAAAAESEAVSAVSKSTGPPRDQGAGPGPS